MQPGKVQCLRCGWQNNVGDRVCGGCGYALSQSGSLSGVPQDYTPTVVSSGPVPPPLPPNTRTAAWAAPASPQPLAPGTATVAAPSRAVSPPPYVAASGARPRATSGNCLGRALIALGVAALLSLLLMACGWAAFVRPALHASIDSHLRAGLAAEIDKVPAIPPGTPPITRTITDTAFNQQAGSPNNQGDLKDIRVHFLPGEVVMTFQLWGRPGEIATHVVTRSGRLFVQDTQVTGWLAQVENGNELQDALNQSLARLPAQDYVESVVLGDGTLTVTIRPT